MSTEISWDDADNLAATNDYNDPVAVTTPGTHPEYRGNARASYDVGWLGWFTIDRAGNGWQGKCCLCDLSHYVASGKTGSGALARCRLAMEQHAYAAHVERTMVAVLGPMTVLDFSGDPPY